MILPCHSGHGSLLRCRGLLVDEIASKYDFIISKRQEIMQTNI